MDNDVNSQHNKACKSQWSLFNKVTKTIIIEKKILKLKKIFYLNKKKFNFSIPDLENYSSHRNPIKYHLKKKKKANERRRKFISYNLRSNA